MEDQNPEIGIYTNMFKASPGNLLAMPSKSETDAVFSRLRALFDAICEEAQRNPEFFERIQSILMSEAAIISVEKSAGKTSRKPILPIVDVMHTEGEQGLRIKLDQLTNDQLARLSADEGIKRLKEAKSIERKELISMLVEMASSRLRQGETFTR